MVRSSPPSRASVSTHESEIPYSKNSQSLDPKQRHQCQSKMIWERKEGEQNSDIWGEGQQKDSNIESPTMADWYRSGCNSLVKWGKAFLIKFPQDDIKKKGKNTWMKKHPSRKQGGRTPGSKVELNMCGNRSGGWKTISVQTFSSWTATNLPNLKNHSKALKKTPLQPL